MVSTEIYLFIQYPLFLLLPTFCNFNSKAFFHVSNHGNVLDIKITFSDQNIAPSEYNFFSYLYRLGFKSFIIVMLTILSPLSSLTYFKFKCTYMFRSVLTLFSSLVAFLIRCIAVPLLSFPNVISAAVLT